MQACFLNGFDAPLYYSVHGNVHLPVLLFVHGVAESSVIWQPAIQLLKNDFCCIAVDLPGHGESAELRGNWSMTFYAQVLRAFLETMQINSVTLVAHSMGAQISCIVALQMSSHISALVLVAPAGIETFSAQEATALKQWSEHQWNQLFAANNALNNLTSNFINFTRPGEKHTKLGKNNFEHKNELREVITGSVAGMLSEPIRSFLPQLHQPVRILLGAHDAFVPNKALHPKLTQQSILDDAEKLFADVRTQLVQHAGHFLPVERPEIIAEQIRKLNKI